MLNIPPTGVIRWGAAPVVGSEARAIPPRGDKPNDTQAEEATRRERKNMGALYHGAPVQRPRAVPRPWSDPSACGPRVAVPLMRPVRWRPLASPAGRRKRKGRRYE